MSQTLNPLYGDIITDMCVAKSASHRPGLLVVPTVVADSARVTITPDASLGFWSWKTRWLKDKGAFTILEDAEFQVDHKGAGHPYQVLVARWAWVEGPLDVQGHPTGAIIAAMAATYGFEDVTADQLDDSVMETTILQPDANGKYGVVLGRLELVGSTWTFTFAPATIMDLAYLNTRQRSGLSISAWYKSTRLAGSVVRARASLTGATVNSIGNAPVVGLAGDLIIQEDGFYQFNALHTTEMGPENATCSMSIVINGTIKDTVPDTMMEEFMEVLIYGQYLYANDIVGFQVQSKLGTPSGGALPYYLRVSVTRL
jgi:hypothetical protein